MNSMLPPGFGVLDGASAALHEWFSSLRRAGFTRMESLYVITRPTVAATRCEWAAQHDADQQ